MYRHFGALVVFLLLNYVHGLTDDELTLIEERNKDRPCGGYMTATSANDYTTIARDGMPDHNWGCTNPNAPSSNEAEVSLPNNPVEDDGGPYCLPMATIAIALNGVSFYNPLTAEALNAVTGEAEETFDCCDGHATNTGSYHYHKLPVGDGCNNPIFDSDNQKDPQFLGVALDGFPIYSQWNDLDMDDLDECHGTNLPDGRYAYIAVAEHYPYILGCYKAKPEGTDDSTQSCAGIKSGELCSCSNGILSYDDITTFSDDEDKKSTLVNKYVRRLFEAILHSRQKRDADADSCHSNQCMTEGWSYSDGECTCSGDDCKMPEGNDDMKPSGDGPSGDGPSGDMSSGDGSSGDGPSGDMPSSDGTSGDMPSGDGPSGDGQKSSSKDGQKSSSKDRQKPSSKDGQKPSSKDGQESSKDGQKSSSQKEKKPSSKGGIDKRSRYELYSLFKKYIEENSN